MPRSNEQEGFAFKQRTCPRAVESVPARNSAFNGSLSQRRKLRNESSAADSLSTLVDLIQSGATVCEREVSWRTRRSHRLDRAPTRRCAWKIFTTRTDLRSRAWQLRLWKPGRSGSRSGKDTSTGTRRECAQWSELTQGKPPRLARHCRRCAAAPAAGRPLELEVHIVNTDRRPLPPCFRSRLSFEAKCAADGFAIHERFDDIARASRAWHCRWCPNTTDFGYIQTDFTLLDLRWRRA